MKALPSEFDAESSLQAGNSDLGPSGNNRRAAVLDTLKLFKDILEKIRKSRAERKLRESKNSEELPITTSETEKQEEIEVPEETLVQPPKPGKQEDIKKPEETLAQPPKPEIDHKKRVQEILDRIKNASPEENEILPEKIEIEIPRRASKKRSDVNKMYEPMAADFPKAPILKDEKPKKEALKEDLAINFKDNKKSVNPESEMVPKTPAVSHLFSQMFQDLPRIHALLGQVFDKPISESIEFPKIAEESKKEKPNKDTNIFVAVPNQNPQKPLEFRTWILKVETKTMSKNGSAPKKHVSTFFQFPYMNNREDKTNQNDRKSNFMKFMEQQRKSFPLSPSKEDEARESRSRAFFEKQRKLISEGKLGDFTFAKYKEMMDPKNVEEKPKTPARRFFVPRLAETASEKVFEPSITKISKEHSERLARIKEMMKKMDETMGSFKDRFKMHRFIFDHPLPKQEEPFAPIKPVESLKKSPAMQRMEELLKKIREKIESSRPDKKAPFDNNQPLPNLDTPLLPSEPFLRKLPEKKSIDQKNREAIERRQRFEEFMKQGREKSSSGSQSPPFKFEKDENIPKLPSFEDFMKHKRKSHVPSTSESKKRYDEIMNKLRSRLSAHSLTHQSFPFVESKMQRDEANPTMKRMENFQRMRSLHSDQDYQKSHK